jgi:tRNA-modifying protein YgfZ
MIIRGMDTETSVQMPLPPLPASSAATSLAPVACAAAGPTAVDGVCRLTDWGVLRAFGADAAQFLHGQLTQDIVHLEAGQARLAGYCSPKGRLLATLVVWRRGADELLLACSADLLPATLKRLSMFVMRAKCKLSDASTECPLWGASGLAAQRLLDPAAALAVGAHRASDEQELVRLPDALVDGTFVPRYLVAGATAPALPTMTEDLWRGLEVHSGVVRVVGATVEQFVPQMVNLELVGGVNFKKGCYPGQEVVARSQYRGTTKRRAFVVSASEALQPGQEVFSSQDPDQPAGLVALAGTSPLGSVALVEMKLAALEGGSLHAVSTGGTQLRLLQLPYELPPVDV